MFPLKVARGKEKGDWGATGLLRLCIQWFGTDYAACKVAGDLAYSLAVC